MILFASGGSEPPEILILVHPKAKGCDPPAPTLPSPQNHLVSPFFLQNHRQMNLPGGVFDLSFCSKNTNGMLSTQDVKTRLLTQSQHTHQFSLQETSMGSHFTAHCFSHLSEAALALPIPFSYVSWGGMWNSHSHDP